MGRTVQKNDGFMFGPFKMKTTKSRRFFRRLWQTINKNGGYKKARWIFTERQGITVATKLHLFNGYSVEKEVLDLYLEMQNLNRSTIKYIADSIHVGIGRLAH